MATVLLGVCVHWIDAGEQPAAWESEVGVTTKIQQLVIDGSRIRAKALHSDETPIVVRVVDVFTHGSAFRYDLEFYGLEPGDYDLADFLEREDLADNAKISAIPIQIVTSLPAGQVEPQELEFKQIRTLGGYRRTLWIGGGLWLIGLLAILLLRRKKPPVESGERVQPVTLADRLRPIVEQAQDRNARSIPAS